MNVEDLIAMSLPWLVSALAAVLISLIIFWLLIYSAMRTALRVDREKAAEESQFRIDSQLAKR